MKNYRVAILGCRARGTASANAYHFHPRTEVVGLCDIVASRRDSLGDELGISARFDDADRMIEDVDPDIVVIPTAPYLHAPLALQVLEHGVNIDIEKPMGLNLAETDAIMAKAVERNLRVAVHHQWRVSAWTQAIWSAFSAGKIGELRHIYASGKGYYGGFGLMEIGTHLLTSLTKFAGAVQRVTAHGTVRGRPISPSDVLHAPRGNGIIVGDRISASLLFENGVIGTLLQHRFNKNDLTAHVIELSGSEGRLLWHPHGAWYLPNPHSLPKDGLDRWKPLVPKYPQSFETLSAEYKSNPMAEGDYWFVEEYVRALDQNTDHECSGASGCHVVEIIMGIFESAAFGRHVNLPQVQRDHPLLRWREQAGLKAPDKMPLNDSEWAEEEERRLKE